MGIPGGEAFVCCLRGDARLWKESMGRESSGEQSWFGEGKKRGGWICKKDNWAGSNSSCKKELEG